MSSQEDEEESIVEYARFHGLSVDPLQDPFPLSHSESIIHTFEKAVLDDSHLEQIEYRPIPQTDEGLTVDKDAAILLAGANGVFLDQSTIDKITAAASTILRRQKLKLELPLLRTDPDADLGAFKQRQNPCICDGNFIYEPLDNEKDEGVQWPSRLANLPNAMLKECTMEKLTVTRDTMVHLQAASKDNWSRENTNYLLRNLLSYKRVCCNLCPLVGFPPILQLMTLSRTLLLILLRLHCLLNVGPRLARSSHRHQPATSHYSRILHRYWERT